MLKGLGYAGKLWSDSSRYFFSKAYRKSISENDVFNMAKSADRVGICYFIEKKYTQSRAWFDTALKHNLQLNDVDSHQKLTPKRH